MPRFRRLWVARIALTAMLFSALSPAMASVLFADRPHLLARVLALPAANLPGDICHTPDAASTSPANPAAHTTAGDDGSGHKAHGVICSFCLPASAVVALPMLVAALSITLDIPLVVISAAPAPRGPAVLLSACYARGPPAVSN